MISIHKIELDYGELETNLYCGKNGTSIDISLNGSCPSSGFVTMHDEEVNKAKILVKAINEFIEAVEKKNGQRRK